MPTVRAQVVLQRDSALPEDVVVNVFHFDCDAIQPGATEMDAIAARLNTFYGSLVTHLSGDFAASGHVVKFYNLNHPSPRAPLGERTITLNTGTNGKGPGELCLVGSFQADKISGMEQAHRRGRVFIGPPASAAMDVTTGRPLAAFVTALANAMGTLKTASNATAAWVVYSSTTGMAAEVSNGWADNAWDVQRRRGNAPTSRTLFT